MCVEEDKEEMVGIDLDSYGCKLLCEECNLELKYHCQNISRID